VNPFLENPEFQLDFFLFFFFLVNPFLENPEFQLDFFFFFFFL